MIIYSSNLNSTTVQQEANALIPHSMKSVAGLYRLFWDAVHIDWPTENHDYRRTGFTLLKGDLTSKEQVKNQMDFFLDSATGTEQVVKPSIADIDADGIMEVIVADVVDGELNWPGKVYVLEGNTGVNQTSYIVGNGGAYASVSEENVDINLILNVKNDVRL